MANLSNCNTLLNNIPATTDTTCPNFKAGDAVLCPSIGNDIYTLEQIAGDATNRLAIRVPNGLHVFNCNGRNKPSDPLPLLFHDTPVNRQAVFALYGVSYSHLNSVPNNLNTPQPLSINALAINYEDALTLKIEHMAWVNSLFDAARCLAKNSSDNTFTINNLMAIGQHLTDNFIYDIDEALEEFRASKEVTK